MQISESLFAAYCRCAYKAHLKSKGEVGEVTDLERIGTDADTRFRDGAIERLLRDHEGDSITREPTSLVHAGVDSPKVAMIRESP